MPSFRPLVMVSVALVTLGFLTYQFNPVVLFVSLKAIGVCSLVFLGARLFKRHLDSPAATPAHDYSDFSGRNQGRRFDLEVAGLLSLDADKHPSPRYLV